MAWGPCAGSVRSRTARSRASWLGLRVVRTAGTAITFVRRVGRETSPSPVDRPKVAGYLAMPNAPANPRRAGGGGIGAWRSS